MAIDLVRIDLVAIDLMRIDLVILSLPILHPNVAGGAGGLTLASASLCIILGVCMLANLTLFLKEFLRSTTSIAFVFLEKLHSMSPLSSVESPSGFTQLQTQDNGF